MNEKEVTHLEHEAGAGLARIDTCWVSARKAGASYYAQPSLAWDEGER